MHSLEKEFNKPSKEQSVMDEFKAKNFYERLGVGREASADEIKEAFRKLSKEHHPDKGGKAEDAEVYKFISEAYTGLKNPKNRWRYDSKLDGDQRRFYYEKQKRKEKSGRDFDGRSGKFESEENEKEERLKKLYEELQATDKKRSSMDNEEHPEKKRSARYFEAHSHPINPEIWNMALRSLSVLYDMLPHRGSIKTKEVRKLIGLTEINGIILKWGEEGKRVKRKFARRVAWLYWHRLPKSDFIAKGLLILDPVMAAETLRRSMKESIDAQAEDEESGERTTRKFYAGIHETNRTSPFKSWVSPEYKAKAEKQSEEEF